MYQAIASNQFGKDYKKCVKKTFSRSISRCNNSIHFKEQTTSSQNKMHKLEGKYKNCWECHVQPDWLLIWQIDEKLKSIYLVGTGSHSELFK